MPSKQQRRQKALKEKPASAVLVSAALSSPLRRPHPPSRPPEMCPLKINKYRRKAAAEAWTFGRGSWAIQSAIVRLLKPSGSKNMAGSISATGGLRSSPGLSRAAGQIGKSDFFCSLFRPRARFAPRFTHLGREGGGSCPSFRRQRGRSDGRMRRNGAGYGRCFVSRTGGNSATKHPAG